MTNTPPTWPHGAPPPGGQALPPPGSGASRPTPAAPQGTSPFRPLAPPVGPGPDQAFDATGPGAPLGAPAQGAVSIDQFRPGRSRAPFWIAVVTALALAALIGAALFLSGRPATGASPSPTATTAPTSTRTPMRSGQGLPFESTADHASGFWEIRQQTWRPDGVLLQLAVTVDKGSLTPTFYVFNNDTAEQYRIVLTDAPEPRFPDGQLATGSTSVGNVLVKMPRAEGTLIMTSTSQREAISALPIQK